MAVFRASRGGLAPLQLQLRGNATARLRQVIAAGESSLGSADWPQLSIPSVSGTLASWVTPQGDPGGVSLLRLAYAWTISPSLPGSGGACSALPVSFNLEFPQDCEPVVRPGSTILLFAASAGGHTYNGGMIWEEK